MTHIDGRAFEPKLTATVKREGNLLVLRCPAVGRWRGAPAEGTLISPGVSLGQLEVLGIQHRLLAPTGAVGVVTDAIEGRRLPIPLGFGAQLCILDPEASTAAALGANAEASADAGQDGEVFRSPLSGRFYARASPDKPAFVKVGDIVKDGQTVALLEVMKTFNRITYGGDGLPSEARVTAIVPSDEDDLEQGDPILRLEPR